MKISLWKRWLRRALQPATTRLDALVRESAATGVESAMSRREALACQSAAAVVEPAISGLEALARQSANTAVESAMSRLEALVRQFTAMKVHADFESTYQQMQRTLVNQYVQFRANRLVPYSNIKDAGFRIYSQFEEDGIILYVLSMIGFKTRRVVEICCGSGNECMATNLILNQGFDGLLFDGDEANVNRAREFFQNKKDTVIPGSNFQRPKIVSAWITAENVNDLLWQHECTGDVDLLSLDVDGNEYWIWKAIEAISPRLFVTETQNVIPADKSLTVPYRPDFDYQRSPADFFGVSLLAMTELCRERGYRLIGAHRHGFNAFFLRNDEGVEFFPEVTVSELHDNPYTRWSRSGRWSAVKDLRWLEVGASQKLNRFS